MNLNTCNNCGGVYEYRGGRYVCRACGSYRCENLSDEESTAVYEASRLLFAGDFDGAEEAFSKIIFRYPATAEAYWGRLKAHYRVLYGQDPYGRSVPISCEPLKESVLSTADYRKAVNFSDLENSYFLKEQAEMIEGLRVINDRNEIAQTAAPRPEETIREEFPKQDSAQTPTQTAQKEIAEETEAGKKFPDTPKARKSKALWNVLALVLVVGVIVGASATLATAHFKTSTGTDQHTQGNVSTAHGTNADGNFNDPAAFSKGLAFESNGDGTCTLVGIGSCTDTDIVIPSEYNGMRVTKIKAFCFTYHDGLTSVTIPYGVTKIEESVFSDCTSLRSVNIPASVTSIGYAAFYGCTSLTDVKIPDSVTSVGSSAFRGCTKLTSVEIPGSLKSLAYNMFTDCTDLAFVKIAHGVTSIGRDAFSGCLKLTSAEIPSTVTNIDYGAFRQCVSIKSIRLPNSVQTIGESAFESCVSLEAFTIPASVQAIGKKAFSGCAGLVRVEFLGSLSAIESYTFKGCSSLREVLLPKDLTSIGSAAFSECSNLKTLNISSSLREIKSSAFRLCIALEEIRYSGTSAQWNHIVFEGSWNTSTGDYKVYCTNGTISKNN